jgi:hypothetical protein
VPEPVRRIYRLIHPDVAGQAPSVSAAREAFVEEYGPLNDKRIGVEVAERLERALATGGEPTTSWRIILATWLAEGGGGRRQGVLRDRQKDVITWGASRRQGDLQEQGYRDRTGGPAAKAAEERVAEPASGGMKKKTLLNRLRHPSRKKRTPKPPKPPRPRLRDRLQQALERIEQLENQLRAR